LGTSSLFGVVCAVLALWPLYGERWLDLALDAPVERLVARSAGDVACPNPPYQSLNKGVAVQAASPVSVLVQRFTFTPNTFLEQACLSWLHSPNAGTTAVDLVVYDSNGPGGDPGTLRSSTPVTITSEGGRVEACAVNVGLFLPNGGNYYIGALWDPNGSSFIAATDNAATPQQTIRISDNGTNWFLLPSNVAARSLGIGVSRVTLSSGEWGPSTQLTPDEVFEVSARPISTTVHALSMEPTKIRLWRVNRRNPQSYESSAVPTPTPGPTPDTSRFALGDIQLAPGTNKLFNSFTVGGSYNSVGVVWGTGGPGPTPTVVPIAVSSDRHIETDTAVVDGDPLVQSLNFDGQRFDYFRFLPTLGSFTKIREKPIPSLAGAVNRMTRSRFTAGVANDGSLTTFSRALTPTEFSIEAYIRALGADTPAVKLVDRVQGQDHASESAVAMLQGPDGEGGSDYPVLFYQDRKNLHAVPMEWRDSTTLLKLGQIPVATLPTEFSAFAVSPGASGSQALVLHADANGDGRLEIIDFFQFKDPSTWEVRRASQPGFKGKFPYTGVITEPSSALLPGSPLTRSGGALPDGEATRADLEPRAATQLEFPFFGPPGLTYQSFQSFAAPCVKTARSLCLSNRRFRIEARFRRQNGQSGVGEAVELSPDTGYFTFFDPANVEVVLKVLDKCSGANRFWVFAGGLTDVEVDLIVTDMATGAARVYHNALKQPFLPIQDTGAFTTCGTSSAPSPVRIAALDGAGVDLAFPSSELPEWALDVLDAADARLDAEEAALSARAGNCVPSATSLCLTQGRFRVQVGWRRLNGTTGQGQAVPLTSDTGYFWFFDPTNVEMVLKVLDKCSGANRFWVFAGGLTNVEVSITVTDTMTGATKTYSNPQGRAFAPIQDTNAFATCP
jgi:hypothetical protein